MADNVAITAGTGTTVHADEYTHATLGAGKTQLVKLVDGTLDSGTAIAAGGGVEAGALRVTIASDSTGVLSVDDNGGALTVDGTVTVNAGTNLNTSALALEAGGNLAAIKAKTDNIPAQGQALAAASLPVVLTAAQITTLTPPAAITGFATAANQLPDGHNVTVDNASIAVTGTFWQATQPVSGTVTANLSATDNAVLDDIAADTEAIKTSLAGTITVTGGGGGVQYTEGDTDTTITGTAALVEGAANALAVLTQPLTDTQLRATAVPVSGTFYQATQPVSFTGSGDVATQTTLAAMNAKMVTGTDIGDVTINNSTGAAAVNIQDGGNVITVDGTVAVTNADLATLAGSVSATHMQADVLTLPANASVNVAQINGVTTLMGAGNTGTGSQRVTIASDQAAVASKAAINTYVDGSIVTLGAKADAKSTATDTTAVTMMQVMKQISASVQAPPSQAVTNAGTFAVQATLAAETTKVIGTVNVAAAQTLATVTTVGSVTAITNALPAGTNAIGKLAANSGVDIGDVTLTAGTAEVGSLLPPDTDVTAHTNYARKYYTNAGAVTDGIIWSPAAGKRWHVTTLYLQVSADATVTLEDDKAGGDDPVWKGEIAAKSGVVLQFTEQYPMASGEDAADLLVTTSAGNVYVTAVGYEV